MCVCRKPERPQKTCIQLWEKQNVEFFKQMKVSEHIAKKAMDTPKVGRYDIETACFERLRETRRSQIQALVDKKVA